MCILTDCWDLIHPFFWFLLFITRFLSLVLLLYAPFIFPFDCNSFVACGVLESSSLPSPVINSLSIVLVHFGSFPPTFCFFFSLSSLSLLPSLFLFFSARRGMRRKTSLQRLLPVPGNMRLEPWSRDVAFFVFTVIR